MGYKLLGFVVWQGIKLYLSRRTRGPWPKAAVAGLAGAVVVGAIAAGRHQAQE
jgi:hypothetical protein